MAAAGLGVSAPGARRPEVENTLCRSRHSAARRQRPQNVLPRVPEDVQHDAAAARLGDVRDHAADARLGPEVGRSHLLRRSRAGPGRKEARFCCRSRAHTGDHGLWAQHSTLRHGLAQPGRAKKWRTSFPVKTCATRWLLMASCGTSAMKARQVGLEPTTSRLTAGCSTIELLPNWVASPRRERKSEALATCKHRRGLTSLPAGLRGRPGWAARNFIPLGRPVKRPRLNSVLFDRKVAES